MKLPLAPQPWDSDIDRKIGELIDVDEKSTLHSLLFLDKHMKERNGRVGVPLRPRTSQTQQTPIDWTKPAEVARIRSMFAHSTKFDLLTDQTEEKVAIRSLIKYDLIHDPEEPLLDFPEELTMTEKVKRGELIPQFEDKFWRTYGNKLRIFGTAEEILDLSGGMKNGV